MEDSRIIDLYLARDESAILRTQEKYGSRLRNVSLHIVDDTMAAEECENDTYLHTWNSIPPNSPREHFYGYLLKIIRNLSLNLCRSRQTLKRSAYVVELSNEMQECIPGAPDPEAMLEYQDLQVVLNDFLRGLSEEKRNMFLRRYYFLEPVADIAKRFSLSQNNVKITLLRCRRQLRSKLEKEGFHL